MEMHMLGFKHKWFTLSNADTLVHKSTKAKFAPTWNFFIFISNAVNCYLRLSTYPAIILHLLFEQDKLWKRQQRNLQLKQHFLSLVSIIQQFAFVE